MPYEAPETGYLKQWSWHTSRVTGTAIGARSTMEIDIDLARRFSYRVRSEVAADGTVVRAFYVKIQDPLYFQPFEEGESRVGLVYYLNPDGTRNLEFDPQRNLFEKLSPKERVFAPRSGRTSGLSDVFFRLDSVDKLMA